MRRTTILGIESAISEGSVAVLQGNDVLASRNGVSRAESLIFGINSAIENAGIVFSDVDTVAVSIGPGSFTGIRIGMATGIGLARSIGLNCIGISVFEAIAGIVPDVRSSVFISIGRNRYGVQDFDPNGKAICEPFSISELELSSALEVRNAHQVHFCGRGDEVSLVSQFKNVVCVNQELSILIARHSTRSGHKRSFEPIYLNK